ncbi:TonB-dependent receptor [Catenovulum agarivorans]|uniref:TonB-dependent receptor n=1 Tax=Catenovulum agarivorans TaxID=1172192 RepID=UPI0002EDD1B2|nr:TonB-dependent receptor [Catenovulum agarivorans]
MGHKTFKLSAVSTAMLASLMAGHASYANAEETVDETITVTGIRGSIMRAMDTKRESKGVVDAISSEDIGKMPDSNLAESLQRITGVSIDRSNGEGSKVTVRGFGPDFNLVTLNGRQMPVSSLEATSASSSRSFDFANLASEGVAGVQVYKTGRASIPTGGIGSTINIETHKPLTNPGFKASVGVKAVHDTSTEKGASLTPEFSALISDTFFDDKIGVSLSTSYQNRESGNKRATTGGWRTFSGVADQDWGAGTATWGGIPDGPDSGHDNRPGDEDVYSVPQSLGYAFHEVQRTRTNGQLTLQFQPVESLTTTVDYTYSKNEVETQFNDMSAWFNFGPSTGVWTDGPNASALIYAEQTPDNKGDFTMGAGDYATISENKSIGFNADWQVSDNFNVVVDYHSSTAESKPNSPYGSNNVISAATWVRGETIGHFDQDFPVLELLDDVDGNPVTINPADMRITGSSFRDSRMKMEIDQLQVHTEYKFDDGIVESIQFGLSSTETNVRSAYSNVQRDTWGGVGEAGDFADDFWPLHDFDGEFNIPGADNPKLQTQFFKWDFATVRARAAELYSTGEGDCGTGFCTKSEMDVDRTTVEEVKSAYAQANLVFDIGTMPANLSTGLRIETTDVFSTARFPDYEALVWTADNEFFAVDNGTKIETSLEGDYSHWLPSLDFDIELTDDLVLRASYSKTITRPKFNDIQGGITIDQPVRVNGGTGFEGNPELVPFESSNYDLSVEWYYDEGSYLSVGYYMKDVENFIGTKFENREAFNIPHPANGPRYQEAFEAVGNDSAAIRQYIFDNYGDTEYVDVDKGQISAIPGEDGVSNFLITIPVNERANKVYGWEVALQHVFGDSGFGGIINFTTVDGDIEYDNFSLDQQFPLIGASDSANLVLFYDKHGIQARIAYNWRDDFLSSTAQDTGANPTYVQAYGQVDANVSYNINDNLSVFVEAINLTDEYSRSYGRTTYHLLNATQTGPRYNIGARYTF